MIITLSFNSYWSWSQEDGTHYYVQEWPGLPIAGSVTPYWPNSFSSEICIEGRFTSPMRHWSLEEAKERVRKEMSYNFEDWHCDSIWI